MLFDTTVQEQNITFPTDSKLRAKALGRCWKLAKRYGVKLRRSYKSEVKVLVRGINFTRGVKKNQIVNKYGRRLKTVAGALVRELKNAGCGVDRKRHFRRSAIEPIIGHMKNDFRMARNFLKHTLGDAINAIMAAAAFNFKKWMRTIGVYLRLVIFRLFTLFFRLNQTTAPTKPLYLGAF